MKNHFSSFLIWMTRYTLPVLGVFLLFSASPIFGQDHILSGQLPNGLTYYIHSTPSRKHISVDLIVKVGSLMETDTQRGFSHLLEHLIAGQMKFKDKKIEDEDCEIWDFSLPEIDQLTSYTFTQYHLDVSLALKNGLPETLLGLSNAIFHLEADPESIDKEKLALLEEIMDTKRSPYQVWREHQVFFEQFHANHPQGPLDIFRAQPKDLFHFYKQHYQPHRMALIIVGNVDLSNTQELISTHFGDYISDFEPAPVPPQPYHFNGIMTFSTPYLKETYLSLATYPSLMSQKDSLIYSMFTRLLSQHLQEASNKGFSNIFLETSSHPRQLRINLTLQSPEADTILQFNKTFKSFFATPITPEQFSQVKSQIQEALKKTPINLTLSQFYRDHFLLQNFPLDDHPNLRPQLLDTISLQDLITFIQQFPTTFQVSLGTYQDTDPFESSLEQLPWSE